MKIHIAHSPDADDAFMFYPLLQGKIGLNIQGPIEFEEVREDIETLNQKATEGVYEVTAVSFHAFPYIAGKYLLLTTGACFGDRYGPLVVAAKPLKPRQLLKVRLGIPGKMTTSFLALKLYEHHVAAEGKSGICYSQVPFDQIMDQIIAGKIDAGLIIHEGQLTYADKGLHKVVDLGEWWHKETGLPLPLGGIAIRRDLDPGVQQEIARLIQESIRYALEHKEEALQAALPFARGLDPERAAKFIEMYVNDMTIDFGRKGLKSIKTLLDKGYENGVLTEKINLDECLFDLKKGRPIVSGPTPATIEAEKATESPSEVPSSPTPMETTERIEPTETTEERTDKIPPDET